MVNRSVDSGGAAGITQGQPRRREHVKGAKTHLVAAAERKRQRRQKDKHCDILLRLRKQKARILGSRLCTGFQAHKRWQGRLTTTEKSDHSTQLRATKIATHPTFRVHTYENSTAKGTDTNTNQCCTVTQRAKSAPRLEHKPSCATCTPDPDKAAVRGRPGLS